MAGKEQVFQFLECVMMAPQETDEDSREEAPAMPDLTCHKGWNPKLWWLRPLG